MGDGSKGSTVIPETSSSKDSNVTSKKSDLGTPKKIISKIKETLLKQSQIQHKLLQQRIKQQKLTKKVQKKSISKLPLFWGYMTSEHRAMWNEGNPYLRQSLTRYYNIYGNQK